MQNIKLCERCAKRCRVSAERNPDADLFVKGTAKTGKLCAECVVADFLLNCDRGPQIVSELFRNQTFDPQCLRQPHIQEAMRRIIVQAAKQFGGELTFDEIDWDEVIANWHLPFPSKKRRKR